MVANTCNGAYARKAAILALIIPRRATKGLLVGQDSECNIDLTTYMHIKCVDDPRHIVHNDQGGYTQVQNMISPILIHRSSTLPPPHSPPPHCSVSSLGVHHL